MNLRKNKLYTPSEPGSTVDPALTLIYTPGHVANRPNHTGGTLYPEPL